MANKLSYRNKNRVRLSLYSLIVPIYILYLQKFSVFWNIFWPWHRYARTYAKNNVNVLPWLLRLSLRLTLTLTLRLTVCNCKLKLWTGLFLWPHIEDSTFAVLSDSAVNHQWKFLLKTYRRLRMLTFFSLVAIRRLFSEKLIFLIGQWFFNCALYNFLRTSVTLCISETLLFI